RELLRAGALERLGRPHAAALEVARRDLEAEAALTDDARSLVALAAVAVELEQPVRARALLERARSRPQIDVDALLGRGVLRDVALLSERLGQSSSDRDGTTPRGRRTAPDPDRARP
ncbi:MAG: hypothetical protein AAGF23_13250, partial [Acidobacteriota bacterium]